MHSEEVPKKEVSEILKTLEYIRGLTEQGRKEMAHMWNYIGTFGFYIFVGSFAGTIFHEWRVWVWALPFAFIFSTGPSLGWVKCILTWGILSAVVWLLSKVVTDPLPFIFILILLAFVGFTFLYRTSGHGRKKKRAFTVAPRLGTFWGILMGGTAVNIFALAQSPSMNQTALNSVSSIIWPFATGIGYLITGFFTSKEFVILGLLTIFGIPIVFAVAPNLTFTFYGIIGLLIGIFGIRLRLHSEREAKEVEAA